MTNPSNPAKLRIMVREISAGGVVVRNRDGVWWMAAIEPQKSATADASDPPKPAARAQKPTLALPKGLVDAGEKALDTALREVREETGVTAEIITKLADIKYVYLRSWGDGERVFKIVSFYLMRCLSGEIDHVSPEMRVEVARALWIPLDEAPQLLAYRGKKEMAKKALDYVSKHADLLSSI